MENMETDSLEELWSYDQEMTDGFFSRKEENKKPSGGACEPAKKVPEKCPEPKSPTGPHNQKSKSACSPEKQQRPASPKAKPSCSRPSKPVGHKQKSACAEKSDHQKKVKRAACGVLKKRRKKPPCGSAEKRHGRRKSKMPRSRNPFIIFFLKMLYSQCPQKHVTEVARKAGKKWCSMTDDQKKIYQKMATMEQRRRCKSQQRQERRAKRKCG